MESHVNRDFHARLWEGKNEIHQPDQIGTHEKTTTINSTIKQ